MKLKNIQTGEIVEVEATTDHPACPYNQSIWIDKDNNVYGVVGWPVVGYEMIYDTHPIISKVMNKIWEEKISINKLSKLSGISRASITGIIKGKNSPCIDTLEKICAPLGLTLDIITTTNTEN